MAILLNCTTFLQNAMRRIDYQFCDYWSILTWTSGNLRPSHIFPHALAHMFLFRTGTTHKCPSHCVAVFLDVTWFWPSPFRRRHADVVEWATFLCLFNNMIYEYLSDTDDPWEIAFALADKLSQYQKSPYPPRAGLGYKHEVWPMAKHYHPLPVLPCIGSKTSESSLK